MATRRAGGARRSTPKVAAPTTSASTETSSALRPISICRRTARSSSGLIAEADVVVDNFRVGTLERRGVSPAAWCDRRPELIWCTITGFGADVARPGYDFVTQAECGWMAITGEPDGDPMKVGVALADVLAGKDAAIAILASLFRKEREGKGGRIVISLVDSAQGGARERCAKRPVDGQGREALGERASESRSVSTLQGGGPADRDRGGHRRTMGRVCSRPWTSPSSPTIPRCRTTPDASPSANESSRTSRARLPRSRPRRGGLSSMPRRPERQVQSVLETLRDTNASALTGVPSSVGGSVRLAPPGLNAARRADTRTRMGGV